MPPRRRHPQGPKARLRKTSTPALAAPLDLASLHVVSVCHGLTVALGRIRSASKLLRELFSKLRAHADVFAHARLETLSGETRASYGSSCASRPAFCAALCAPSRRRRACLVVELAAATSPSACEAVKALMVQVGSQYALACARRHIKRVRARPNAEAYRVITEAIPHLLWRTNLDGSADYINDQFARYLGYSQEAMMGWGWVGIIHPDDRDRVASEWQRCRDACLPVRVEFRVECKGRGYRWFLSRGNPFRDERGQVTKYYGTWTDIDEERRTFAERDFLIHELRQALQARDNFLRVASHELKTPLVPLKLQMQALRRALARPQDAELLPRIARVIDLGDKQVDRLVGLIDLLLDVARLRDQKLPLHCKSFDLSALLLNIASQYTPTAEAARCTLTVHTDGPAVGFWDPTRLEQIVVNLLLNAFTYAAGTPVALVLTRHDNYVGVRVEDQGRGLEPQDIERIFRRFERVELKASGGLGLGLYISRQLAEAHGGSLKVSHRDGGGCVFVLSLPWTVASSGPL